MFKSFVLLKCFICLFTTVLKFFVYSQYKHITSYIICKWYFPFCGLFLFPGGTCLSDFPFADPPYLTHTPQKKTLFEFKGFNP